ncbi:MAG: tetratricopeptide repeat-containing serine protease family protein, partial [Nitrospirota bacterium]
MIIHRRMRFSFLLISSLILLILSPTGLLADTEEFFKENNGSVVVINTYDKRGKPINQGSGFIVRDDGAIATNYHIISNAKAIKVKSRGKLLKVEGLIHTDVGNDLVILKVKGKGLPAVKMGDIEKAVVGENVYLISSPEGHENKISEGVLSLIRWVMPDVKILQITTPVLPGSSGGPVFNKNGEVIGIATFIIENKQELNFAIPVNFIKDKISGKKVTPLKNAKITDYKKTTGHWFYLGIAYDVLSMPKEAMEAYKEAIKIKPDFAEAHNNLGTAYGGLGMDKETMEAYKEAIKIKPDFAWAHNNLGTIYGKLKMHKEAIEVYKEAIKINPNYAEAYFNLGVSYIMLKDGPSAFEQYKKLLELNP